MHLFLHYYTIIVEERQLSEKNYLLKWSRM
jgi:hypothetical protein